MGFDHGYVRAREIFRHDDEMAICASWQGELP